MCGCFSSFTLGDITDTKAQHTENNIRPSCWKGFLLCTTLLPGSHCVCCICPVNISFIFLVPLKVLHFALLTLFQTVFKKPHKLMCDCRGPLSDCVAFTDTKEPLVVLLIRTWRNFVWRCLLQEKSLRWLSVVSCSMCNSWWLCDFESLQQTGYCATSWNILRLKSTAAGKGQRVGWRAGKTEPTHLYVHTSLSRNI